MRTFVTLIFSFSFFIAGLPAQQVVDLKTIKVENLRTIHLGTHVLQNGKLVQSSPNPTAQGDTLYDNTQSQNVFLNLTDDLGLSLPQEVIDWGTTVGGTIESLTFSYVTELTQNSPPGQPGNLEDAGRTVVEFNLYWDTDLGGDGQKFYTFPHIGNFSPDGSPTRFDIDVDLSGNPLSIPAGRIGFGYKILAPSNKTGPLLATGGKGATRLFRIKPAFGANNLFLSDLSLSGSYYLQLRGQINPTADNAEDDAYETPGNIGITVTASDGLLANDASADSVETGDRSSAEGGTVTVSRDGSFTYDPPAGFEGMDSFTYIMRDNQGVLNCATVNVNVTKPVWFIDRDHPGLNRGTFLHPFVALVDFNNAQNNMINPRMPKEGHTIYLFSAQEVYNADGIELKLQQVLAGQGLALLVVLQALGIPVQNYSDIFASPPEAGIPPTISSSTGAGIQLADDNKLMGFNIGASLTYGINGAGSGSLTVNDVDISGTGGALNLEGYTLDATFGSISSTDAPEKGIRLNGTFGRLIIPGSTVITNATGAGIDIENSDMEFTIGGSYSYTGKLGISLRSNLGTYEFSEVDITTNDSTGMVADSAGTIQVDGGSISSTNGIGLKLKHSNLNVTFDTVSSSGGRLGIKLKNTTGNILINGGIIQNTISDGIRSKNADGVRLRNIDILNSGRHGLMRFGSRFDLDADNLTIDGSVNEGVFGQLSLNSEYGNSSNNSGLQKITASRPDTNKFILTNSEISNTGGDGVKIQVGGTDSADVIITGNTVTADSGFGLTVQTSDSGFALVELANNTSMGPAGDFNLVQDSTSTFALKGFTGGDSAAVAAFIQSNNNGTPTVHVTGMIRAETTTSVSGPGRDILPTEFALEQNYPNPFNPSTSIQFALPKQSEVTVTLFDLLGRKISTLVNEELQAGNYKFTFEANDLPTGIYFYRLRADGFVATKKLTLLK